MARARKTAGKPASSKRPIEQYDHKGQKRKNNPPVGLVTDATDRDAPKKQYVSKLPSDVPDIIRAASHQ